MIINYLKNIKNIQYKKIILYNINNNQISKKQKKKNKKINIK